MGSAVLAGLGGILGAVIPTMNRGAIVGRPEGTGEGGMKKRGAGFRALGIKIANNQSQPRQGRGIGNVKSEISKGMDASTGGRGPGRTARDAALAGAVV